MRDKKFCTHQVPTRRNFGPTKYLREKNSKPQSHGGTIARDQQ